MDAVALMMTPITVVSALRLVRRYLFHSAVRILTPGARKAPGVIYRIKRMDGRSPSSDGRSRQRRRRRSALHPEQPHSCCKAQPPTKIA